ncbi:hypothetical protein BJ546DRAFT_34241 [Cryomyces antarcticus]
MPVLNMPAALLPITRTHRISPQVSHSRSPSESKELLSATSIFQPTSPALVASTMSDCETPEDARLRHGMTANQSPVCLQYPPSATSQSADGRTILRYTNQTEKRTTEVAQRQILGTAPQTSPGATRQQGPPSHSETVTQRGTPVAEINRRACSNAETTRSSADHPETIFVWFCCKCSDRGPYQFALFEKCIACDHTVCSLCKTDSITATDPSLAREGPS